jgi:hypothetical protein
LPESLERITNGQLTINDLTLLKVFRIEGYATSCQGGGSDERIIDAVAVLLRDPQCGFVGLSRDGVEALDLKPGDGIEIRIASGKVFEVSRDVLIYAVAQEDPRGTRAEELLRMGGILNVQVRSEQRTRPRSPGCFPTLKPAQILVRYPLSSYI